MTYDTPFLKAPIPFLKISVTDGGLFLLTNGEIIFRFPWVFFIAKK